MPRRRVETQAPAEIRADDEPDEPGRPAPAWAAKRGVYSYTDTVSGQTMYIATTAAGLLLRGTPRARLPDETDAMIATDLWNALKRGETPVRRLALCR